MKRNQCSEILKQWNFFKQLNFFINLCLFMGRCVCILTSGPRKGARCSHRAKPRSRLCGYHKNCQKSLEPQIREPQPFELCPEQLRPIDGRCPPKFPNQRRLPDGSTCCWGQLKRIRKMRPRTHQMSTDLINPGEACVIADYNHMVYYPADEFPTRPINRSGSDCPAFDRDLLQELPSLAWIRAQEQYIVNLASSDQALIKFYTYYGDVMLNNFVRHRWSISEEDFDYLLVRSKGSVITIFQMWLQLLQLTYEDSVERLLMGMYHRLNQIIAQSPINPQRFVSYRGSRTKDYFESTQTQKPKIFQSVGFFSTSLLIGNAKNFAKGG